MSKIKLRASQFVPQQQSHNRKLKRPVFVRGVAVFFRVFNFVCHFESLKEQRQWSKESLKHQCCFWIAPGSQVGKAEQADNAEQAVEASSP